MDTTVTSCGRFLGDRYQLLRPLIGDLPGMSEVYKAYDSRLDRLVVVKRLRVDLAQQPALRQRFAQEAQIMSCLAHPNIVTIHDAGEDGEQPYFVMEYLAGGSLSERLARDGQLNPQQTATIIEQVAAAVDYLHQQQQPLVHRDIKPPNILLENDGRAKLADLGLAALAYEQLPEQAGIYVGSYAYMAPEQFLGHAVGPATDIYGLGVVAFELLTGITPFRGNHISIADGHLRRVPPSICQLNYAVSPQVEAVVGRALSKLPEQRHTTAGEFADALQRAVIEGIDTAVIDHDAV